MEDFPTFALVFAAESVEVTAKFAALQNVLCMDRSWSFTQPAPQLLKTLIEKAPEYCQEFMSVHMASRSLATRITAGNRNAQVVQF